jgi:outer membrane protein OmpA-like peptidoglycan-associated protein
MTVERRHAVLAALAVAVFASGCGPKSVRTDADAQQVLVVLMPDQETGTTGKVVVSNTAGQTELSTPYSSTRVTSRRVKPPAKTLKESDVMKEFGDVIATLPPPPLHFTLYFRFDSEELTDDSRKLVQEVLKSVKAQPVPDVIVIGHTDTTGSQTSNFELGLRRANAVRGLLIEAGLSASAIDASSHGELELLVPTANDVFEPKNRRVEITVR